MKLWKDKEILTIICTNESLTKKYPIFIQIKRLYPLQWPKLHFTSTHTSKTGHKTSLPNSFKFELSPDSVVEILGTHAHAWLFVYKFNKTCSSKSLFQMPWLLCCLRMSIVAYKNINNINFILFLMRFFFVRTMFIVIILSGNFPLTVYIQVTTLKS